MRLARAVLLALLLTTAAFFGFFSHLPRVHAADRAVVWFEQEQGSPSAAPTLKVYSRETYVDVTVTEKDGKPVHGLTKDDFTILEDGKPMSPNSFVEHSSADLAVNSTAPAKPVLPPNTFTNLHPNDGQGPINILLFDSSNLPVMTQHIVLTQMRDFVDRMRPGTRAAVLG